VANLAWWQAEMNRDRKARREPYRIEDFFHFPPDAGAATSNARADAAPPAAAGAAMRELIRLQQFPSFALSFYAALQDIGDDEDLPARLAWIAEDAILLAPKPAPGDRWQGFLIAEDTAAGQVRRFQAAGDDDGPAAWLAVPAAPERGVAVWAAAGASLPIQQSPDAPGEQSPPLP
jgi:hypothetical protein